MKINLFLNKNVKSAIFEEQNGKFLFKREDSINTLLCGLKERQMVENKIWKKLQGTIEKLNNKRWWKRNIRNSWYHEERKHKKNGHSWKTMEEKFKN